MSIAAVPEIGHAVSLSALVLGPLAAFLEANELNFGYSKFSNRLDRSPEIPSLLGFLIGYSMPLVAVALTYISSPTTPDSCQDLVVAMNVVHYVKRNLECSFVHKYSGGMNMVTCGLIAAFYSLCAFVHVATATMAPRPSSATVAIGLLTFSIGQGGNFYHHYLLSRLRHAGEKRYKVPTGGLFHLICCPHYLFELVSWLGIALVSQHHSHFLTLFGFSCYLAGRSTATMKWYQMRMNGKDKDQILPAGWKRLIPGLF